MICKQHLKLNYESIYPWLHSLHTAYPDVISAEIISYQSYLWATQLWYAYAMEVSLRIYREFMLCHLKVEFLDAEVRSCLVPYAGLMNHSPWPHVVRYGKVDAATQTLE